MPANPIIEIRNLSAGYDGRTVLHDVDLTVYERDFLGIIGPNGGGKTTLVKCILGLLKPTAGTIAYHPGNLSLGYLPQYTRIDRKFPITVEEVVLSGLNGQKPLTARLTRADREKARAVVARMGLEGLEKRPIGALSGGQLQRVLMARAIAARPEVLVLDEPDTYIDAQFKEQMHALVARANRRCAVIMVSHDRDYIAAAATQVVEMNR